MTTPLALDNVRGDGGQTVLVAVGEIDQSNINEFSRALTTATTAAADSGETLTVDLSAVDYLDSAAINVLYANSDHIKLIVHPLLIRTLSVSGLSEVVDVETRTTT